MSWRDLIPRLREITGPDFVVDDPEVVVSYLEDETEPEAKPRPCRDVAVVKPGSAEEISQILKLCNETLTPVFVRGGATGLAGGCVPNRPGLVLSMERLKGVEVDKDALMAEAGAGATLADLIKAAEEAGLFFPPHPGDEGAQIGGLIACNAVGARAVRTGPIRNFVLGLEVVTPTGRILHLGGKLVKDNTTGGKLMHVFIGTEGIMGVITRAVLRLWPRFKATATLLAPFEDKKACLGTVPKILRSGVIPLGIEYMEREETLATAERLGIGWPVKEGTCYLLLMLADYSEDAIYSQMEELSELCSQNGALEVFVADSPRDQANLLKVRSELYPTLKPNAYDSVDVAVPPSRIIELMEGFEGLEAKYGLRISVLGHAGDGNLHPSVMIRPDMPVETHRDLYERAKMGIYELCRSLGGTITGEHGIGEARKKPALLNFGPDEIATLKAIKAALDPNGILNPGKVIPEPTS